jgi:CheY-like chemotaxis protein
MTQPYRLAFSPNTREGRPLTPKNYVAPPKVVVSLTRLSPFPTYAQWFDPSQTLSSLEILERCVAKKTLISIVDDDASVREGTVDLIQASGFAAQGFEGAEDFLNSDHIDSTLCLIADVQMPRMTGLELHHRLVAAGKIIPTILLTAYPNGQDRKRALQAGVICYLAKPYNQDDLFACIRSALESRGGDCRRS